MATADIPTHNILTVLPERERVCLRPGPVLDPRALGCLEAEARALVTRGFAQVTIDLRKVEVVDATSSATLAAISQFARSGGARLTVIPGSSPAVRELLSGDVRKDLVIEAPAPRQFFDWSR